MKIDANTEFSPTKRSEQILKLIENSGRDERYKVLVVSDVDSTFIKQEAIDLLAAKSGKEQMVAEITQRAMLGELDFKDSLRQRVSTLSGLPDTILEEVVEQIDYSDGAIELVDLIRTKGNHLALVSGGFIQLLEPLCRQLSIDHFHGNKLEIKNSQLTGFVEGEIVDAIGKANYVRNLAENLDIPLTNVICVGDGANDLEMMKIAGISISFNGKPKVADFADVSIVGPRLDQVAMFI